MSKIDELIQQYCPNGVEYKTLGEVVTLRRGVRVLFEFFSRLTYWPHLQKGTNTETLVMCPKMANRVHETLVMCPKMANRVHEMLVMRPETANRVHVFFMEVAI